MARSTVAVRFTGDTAGLKRALGDIDGKMRTTGSKFANFGKAAAVGFAGVGAGAVVLGKGFVDAAVESQKVTKQTEAVMKSMGGVSNVTADQVAKLSEKLSMQSGIDDELIQSAQNVLLTFGNVRNEVGKGNDVFTRASQSALDMSVALGTDMQGATIQVGKALNDPIKGITALSRAGVSFSSEQKDTIKRLVETGDTLGAQKIILGELDKQFGGSAAAQATAGDKLKVTWGNLQEQLGAKLLPVVEKVAGWLASNLPRFMDRAGRAFDEMRPHIEAVVATVRRHWPQIQATVEAVVQTVVGFIRQHWPEIQRIISQVMTTVSAVISGVVAVITTLWNNFGNNILSFVQRVWPAIQQVISGALEVIRGVIQTVTALIKGDWSGVWDGIKGIISGAWNAIQGIVKAALEALRLAIGGALEVVGSVFKGAWDGIVGWFKGIPSRFGTVVDSIIATIARVISWVRDMPGRIGRAVAGMWNKLKTGLKAAVDWIIGQIDRALGPIDELLGKLSGIKGSLSGTNVSGKDAEALFGPGGLHPVGERASGGPVRSGRSYLIGERGPELLTMGANGYVTPNHRLAAAGGGGSVIYNLTFNVPPNADAASVGKAVVEVISAYERKHGRRWRS